MAAAFCSGLVRLFFYPIFQISILYNYMSDETKDPQNETTEAHSSYHPMAAPGTDSKKLLTLIRFKSSKIRI